MGGIYSGGGGVGGIFSPGGFSWPNIGNQVIRYNPSDADNPPTTSTAAYFNGTNGLYSESASPITALPCTAICWFKTSSATVQTLLFFGNKASDVIHCMLYIDASGHANARIRTTGTSVDAEIAQNFADGAWHAIAGTWDATTVDVYLDAQTPDSQSHSITPSGYDAVSVGYAHKLTKGNWTIGYADNAYVWSVKLTAAQIAWVIANKPTLDDLETSTDANNPGTTNLVFAPPLNNTAPGKWVDLSDSELHLTEYGAAKGVTFASASSQWANTTAISTTPGVSMCCSFKTTANNPGTNQGLMCVGENNLNKLLVFIRNTNVLRVLGTSSTGSLNADSAATYTDQAWHFAAGVFAGTATITSVTLDVDGNSTSDSTAPVTPDNPYTNSSIASLRADAASITFDGTLDNVSFWSIALSVAQRTYLRTGGIGGGPASYRDVISSQHPDNPFLTNPSALKAWYTLDEAAGPTIVNVHNAGTYDLTAVAGPTFAQTGHVIEYPRWGNGTVTPTAEVEDRALLFRSSATQYGYNNNAPFTAHGKTMAVWVRTSTAATQRFLWVGDKDVNTAYYALGSDVAGNAILIRQANGGSDTTTGAAINDGRWHLLVAVITGIANVDLYVDGNAAVNDLTSVAMTAFDNVTISAHGGPTKTGLYANAIIDDPMIFNALLTATDVGDLYNGGAGLTAADLVSGAESITSAAIPQYAWPLNARRTSGNTECIGSTGGLTLTLSGSPTSAEGIPAGRSIGGTVYSLPDVSGSTNVHNATQTDITKRPVLVKIGEYQGNDVFMLKFDGVDDYLAVDMSTGESAGDWSVITVTYQDQSTRYLFDTASGRIALVTKFASGNFYDGTAWRGSQITLSQESTISWLLKSADASVYKDGAVLDSGTGYTQRGISSTTIIGCRYDLATGTVHSGRVGDFLIVSGVIPVAQHNAVGREMALKYANASIPAWTTVT